MEYALIKAGRVENVIVAGVEFVEHIAGEWDHIEPLDTAAEQGLGVGIGWGWDGGFTPPEAAPSQPPEPRRITLGALQKRIGPMRVFAIDTSTHPVCVALRSYLSRLTFIDLDDPDLPPMLGMLVAAEQPAANPVFPGSGPVTEADVDQIIGAPVAPEERP